MLTVKNVEISGESVDKVLNTVKSFWGGIPKFLRWLLISVVSIGAIYFLYTRVIMTYDMVSLESEVAKLNEKCEATVFYDRYTYDISNLIIATENLQNQIDLMYEYHEDMLDIMIEFFQHHHSDAKQYQAMLGLRDRTIKAKNTYKQVLNYQISLYEKWMSSEHKNFNNLEVSTDESGQRHITNLDKHSIPFDNITSMPVEDPNDFSDDD